MSESTWFIDPEAGAVSVEDDDNYDEAYGPGDPHPQEGRLVEDDEGVRSDTTSEAVAHVAVGDTRGSRPRSQRSTSSTRTPWSTPTWSTSTSCPRTPTTADGVLAPH